MKYFPQEFIIKIKQNIIIKNIQNQWKQSKNAIRNILLYYKLKNNFILK